MKKEKKNRVGGFALLVGAGDVMILIDGCDLREIIALGPSFFFIFKIFRGTTILLLGCFCFYPICPHKK